VPRHRSGPEEAVAIARLRSVLAVVPIRHFWGCEYNDFRGERRVLVVGRKIRHRDYIPEALTPHPNAETTQIGVSDRSPPVTTVTRRVFSSREWIVQIAGLRDWVTPSRQFHLVGGAPAPSPSCRGLPIYMEPAGT
jgi:hypothetical protein